MLFYFTVYVFLHVSAWISQPGGDLKTSKKTIPELAYVLFCSLVVKSRLRWLIQAETSMELYTTNNTAHYIYSFWEQVQ